MDRRGLSGDSRGSAYFAFAAVIILLSVATLSSIIADNEKGARELERLERQAKMAEAAREMISSEIELTLQLLALRAGEDSGGPFNISEFERLAMETLVRHFTSLYPIDQGGVRLDANILNLSCQLSPYRGEHSSEVSIPGSLLVGVGASVVMRSQQMEYEDVIEFTSELHTPVPFLSNRLENLQESSTEHGVIGRIVRNILVQVAQMRVFQGYASSVHSWDKGIEEILTVEDVETAVNLALLLFEQATFGSVDPISLEHLAGVTRPGEQVDAAHVGRWAGELVDPFREFLRLWAPDAQPVIDVREFSAQMLYSILDQLFVKYLEYLHMLELFDLAEGWLETIKEGWSRLILLFTGVDVETENAKRWADKQLTELRVPSDAWKTVFSAGPDFVVYGNESTVYISDDRGKPLPIIVGGSEVPVDLPSMSILESPAWAEFSPQLKDSLFTVSEAFERALLSICSRLASRMPAAQLQADLDGEGPIPLAMLDSLSELLASVDARQIMSDDMAGQGNLLIDPLLVLRDFLDGSWELLFPIEPARDSAVSSLVGVLVDGARTSEPERLPTGWRLQLENVLMGQIMNGSLRDWLDLLCRRIASISFDCWAAVIGTIDFWLDLRRGAQGGSMIESFESWVVGQVSAATLMDALRGSIAAVRLQLGNMTREFGLDERVAVRQDGSIRLTSELDVSGDSDLAGSATFSPSIRQLPAYLEGVPVPHDERYSIDNVDPTGRLCVSILSPASESDRLARSVHYTLPGELVAFPYETNWLVEVRAKLRLSSYDALSPHVHVDRDISLSLEIPISCVSGWPLRGVDYESSNTLLGDNHRLLVEVKNRLWNAISPIVEVFHKALSGLLDSLAGLSKYVVGFADRLSKLVLEFGDMLLSKCAEVLEWVKASPLWKLIEVSIDLLGKLEVRFGYGPVTVIVSTSLPDLLFKKAKDIVRIIVVTKLRSLDLSLGFRIAKLSDGSFDIVSNSTVRCGQVQVDLQLDPLMKIRNHLLDITVRWKGLRVDIWSPEINDFRRLDLRLSHLPGVGQLLSSIPVPPLGITISIDAGLSFRYRLPITDHLTINEVELNPPGSDAGNEWVELFNPSGHDISLEGYVLETMHGEIAVLPLSGSIKPRGYRVFTFPRLSLVNGNSADTFAKGDALILKDADGGMVDYTPLMADASNDRKTWQRSWDGSPKWVFVPSTKGKTNGNPLIFGYADLMTKICTDALRGALEREKNNVSASIGFVKNLMGSFLREVIEGMADFAASLIDEFAVWIEVGVNDLSSSVGVGFRFKMTVTGELARQGVLWFAEQLARLFSSVLWHKLLSVNLRGSSHPAEAVFVGYDIFLRAGLPKMLVPLFRAGELPSEVRMVSSFSVNLAMVGAFIKKDWGDWQMIFGIHIDDLPGRSLVSPLFSKSQKVDLWIIRGKIRPA